MRESEVIRRQHGPHPFRHIVEDKFSKLYSFAGNPDFVLRKNDDVAPVEGLIARAQKFRHILRVLADDYDIVAPESSFVIAPDIDTGKPCLYTVSERVEGPNMEQFGFIPHDAYLPVLASLSRYYTDAIFGGKDFMSDIHLGQFMYGSVPSDARPRPYLVDLDIYLNTAQDFEAHPELVGVMYSQLYHIASTALTLNPPGAQDIKEQMLYAANALPYLSPYEDLDVERLYRLYE